MRNNLVVTIWFAIFSMSMAAQAVSIQNVVDLAAKNNLQINISQHKLNIAQAQTDGAWSSIFPKISLSSGVNRMESYSAKLSSASFAGFGAAFANVPSINMAALSSTAMSPMQDYYSAKASVSLVLYNQAAYAAIGVNKDGLAAAKNEYANTLEETNFNVSKLFLNILQMEKQLDNLNESKQQMLQLLDKIQQLKKNGLATQIDVLRTKASVSSLQVNIITVSNNIEIMYGSLEMLLNSPLAVRKLDMDIVNKLYEEKINFDYSLENVLNNRFDYNQLLATIELLQANISIQESNRLPTLMAVGSYGYQGTNGFNFGDVNKDWSYGINGNWNIFDSGATGSKVKEAKENYEILASQAQLLKKSVANELNNDVLGFKSAKAKVASTEEELQVNEEAYLLMNSRYTLGEVTNLELIDAHNQLLSAKNKLISAKIEYSVQVLKWLKDNGQLTKYYNKGV